MIEDLEVAILPAPKCRALCSAMGFINGVPVGNAASSTGQELGCWWPSTGPELVRGFAPNQKTIVASGRARTIAGKVAKGARHVPGLWQQRDGILVATEYILQGFAEVTAIAQREDVTAGLAKTHDADYLAVFWHNGKHGVLAPEKANDDTIAHGTGDGKVVGAIGRAGTRRACWWDIRSCRRFDIPPDGFVCSEVNDAGPGYLVGSGALGDSTRKPLLWNKPEKGDATVLLPRGFDAGEISSCDRDFQAGWVGEMWNRPAHACLWNSSVENFLDLHTIIPGKYTDSEARLVEVEGDIIRIAGSVAVYIEQESHLGEPQRALQEQRAAVWQGRLRS